MSVFSPFRRVLHALPLCLILPLGLAAEIIYENGFEGELPPCSGNCPEIITDQNAREGANVLKSQISASSEISYRTEISLNGIENLNFDIDTEYWIGVSIGMDSDFVDTYEGSDQGMLMQLHYRNWLYDSTARKAQPFVLRYTEKMVKVQSETVGEYFSASDPEYGMWVGWIVRFKLSADSSGVFQVWRNHELVADYRGPNHYEEYVDGAYLKMGLYSSQYKSGIPSANFTRTVYHDALKVFKGANGSDAVTVEGPPTSTSFQPVFSAGAEHQSLSQHKSEAGIYTVLGRQLGRTSAPRSIPIIHKGHLQLPIAQ